VIISARDASSFVPKTSGWPSAHAAAFRVCVAKSLRCLPASARPTTCDSNKAVTHVRPRKLSTRFCAGSATRRQGDRLLAPAGKCNREPSTFKPTEEAVAPLGQLINQLPLPAVVLDRYEGCPGRNPSAVRCHWIYTWTEFSALLLLDPRPQALRLTGERDRDRGKGDTRKLPVAIWATRSCGL